MDSFFKFENKSMIIYGAAAIGLIVYDICKDLNIPVSGFVDKRGDEISEIQGVSVYSVDSSEIDTIDKDSIIFVAVKNVFEHDNIARKLIEKGFNNIVYRPYAVIKGEGSEDEKILYDVYDKFMSKELFEGDIPKSFTVHQYEYKDYATVKKVEDERIVYVPIESLFTDLKKEVSRWSWINIPIMALIPHIAFFRWMDQQEGFSYDMYLKFCIDSTKVKGQINVTERWKQNVIKNRADVYTNMNESLERDFDFFIRNAPRAKWNPDGYFNLVSGKHRASFWIAKGRRYIPLKISDSDYEEWINKSEVNKIVQHLNEMNVFCLNAPVEHPFFYDMQCENKNFYFQLLRDFIYATACEQYENMEYINLKELSTVFISLNDDGYMSRALQRYGIPIVVHNKSNVSVILENLIVTSSEVDKSAEYSYALVEFHYGDEADFTDIMSKNIRYMICLVQAGDIDEFERTITAKYAIIQNRKVLKNGEQFVVYTLKGN